MIKPNGEIVPALKCATCPISSGCSWSCLRGDDLAKLYELSAEVERLQGEAEIWKDRWEAERADHEATMKHADRALDEFSA